MVTGEELVARLAARVTWREIVAGRPEGPDWFALGDGLPAAAWYQDLLEGVAGGRRDVAGAYLLNYVAEPLVGAIAGAAIHDGATWAVRPETFRLRRSAEGWFDALAVEPSEVWAIGDERHADEAAWYDAIAAGLVDVLGPWIAAVRAVAPFGRIGMWGLLADGIGGAALEPVRVDVGRSAAAWTRAERLLDRVATRTTELRARPRCRTVAWSGGDAAVLAQGTCCLYYKVHAPEAEGERYCLGCPLRPAGQSDPLYRRWLDEEYGSATGG